MLHFIITEHAYIVFVGADLPTDPHLAGLTRTWRVKPTVESQTHLTHAVAENPLKMVDCTEVMLPL